VNATVPDGVLAVAVTGGPVTVFAAGFAEVFCGGGVVSAHPCMTNGMAEHIPIRTADVILIEASWVTRNTQKPHLF
jgi:hypothetical protein